MNTCVRTDQYGHPSRLLYTLLKHTPLPPPTHRKNHTTDAQTDRYALGEIARNNFFDLFHFVHIKLPACCCSCFGCSKAKNSSVTPLGHTPFHRKKDQKTHSQTDTHQERFPGITSLIYFILRSEYKIASLLLLLLWLFRSKEQFFFNPSNVKVTFLQRTRMQRFLKAIGNPAMSVFIGQLAPSTVR